MSPAFGSSGGVLAVPGVGTAKTDNSLFCGERGRNRTYNLLIKSQLLCQLSYAPFWVGPSGMKIYWRGSAKSRPIHCILTPGFKQAGTTAGTNKLASGSAATPAWLRHPPSNGDPPPP